jgi:class 3 adenylate cyclase/alpha-beta hydrolase superfamily lysophospholipase
VLRSVGFRTTRHRGSRQTVTVIEPPETNYVSVGDADVAYQIVGEGPRDVLVLSSLGGHVDLIWQIPQGAKYLTEMSAFSRVLHMDRRGSGASDAVPLGAIPTWEALAEDITAVLDAAGSKMTTVLGANEVGPIAILFAAMHPERVSSLVLINTAARYMEADDYPIGVAPATLDAIIEVMTTNWGTGEFVGALSPGSTDDREFLKLVAQMHRAAATPRTAAAQMRYFLSSMDVRPFLKLVQVPTLVLQATDSPFIPLVHGRYLAEHIPEATIVEMPGADLNPPYGPDVVSDIAEFLTGERPSRDVDRVLTTILLTDIVGSTERAASLGDERWRGLLDAHDRAVRERLSRAGGREIKQTGDGFLISFDGPGRGIRCATAITEAANELGIEVRAGLHTGECERRGDDLGGLAVHIAARVNALAAPNEVLVTSTVKDLVVGSGIRFEEQGKHALRGVPGPWKLFAVVK